MLRELLMVTIMLTRNHSGEFRRPFISIASTDKELLIYIKTLTGGTLTSKKNYSPKSHKNSYTLTIKNKSNIFIILKKIEPFLRVSVKKQRAHYILNQYDLVTVRNGKYSKEAFLLKTKFEDDFFRIK